jgi:hypothetical protein
MVYPPNWVTTPMGIFALTDRGDVFQGAALTMLQAGATLALLPGLARLPTRNHDHLLPPLRKRVGVRGLAAMKPPGSMRVPQRPSQHPRECEKYGS